MIFPTKVEPYVDIYENSSYDRGKNEENYEKLNTLCVFDHLQHLGDPIYDIGHEKEQPSCHLDLLPSTDGRTKEELQQIDHEDCDQHETSFPISINESV
jgi:hypothetical protein